MKSSLQISTCLNLLPLEATVLQALIDSMMDGLTGKVGMVSTATFRHAHLEHPIIVDRC